MTPDLIYALGVLVGILGVCALVASAMARR